MGTRSIAAARCVLASFSLFAASCLDLTIHQPVGASVEFVDQCREGPYCVIGEVESQRGLPVGGVRCLAVGAGPDAVAVSNRSGEFFIDGLKSLPRNLRFEKEGFEAQAVSVASVLDQHSRVATVGAPPDQPDRLGQDAAVADDDQDSYDEGNGMRLLVTMRRLDLPK
jgi:hypothetical protein